MNEEQLAWRLREEGYTRTYIWEDPPLAFYPDHTHATQTAHIILEGEMTLSMDGQRHTFRAGEPAAAGDVPAGALHSARMGSAGCRYLIGEK